MPRFSHELIDQTGTQPEDVQGELKVRLMQLLLLAAYHPERPWATLVIDLFGTLSSLPDSGGINYIRIFLQYLLQTQDREVIESFQEALRYQAPSVGEDLMTYAQELLAEGREEGRLEERVRMIEKLLRLNTAWTMIEEVTGVTETQYLALKRQLDEKPGP